MSELQFTVPAEQSGKRIDSWLAEQIEGLTRSAAQNLLSEQAVSCNGQPLKKNYKLVGSEAITVQLPELKEVDLKPENIPLDIVYEDDDLLVVNKPKGMVVHPAPGHATGTLVHALLYHCGDRLSSINGIIRPGIVHRIDRFTSGLLMVAKNDMAHQSLSAQIAAHSFTREYQAVAMGHFREAEGTISAPIGRHPVDRKKMCVTEKNSKPATTHYTVIAEYPRATHLRLRLETGRTHQIRVHLAYLGHPILGDRFYAPPEALALAPRLQLHAQPLTITHPTFGNAMTFKAPVDF